MATRESVEDFSEKVIGSHAVADSEQAQVHYKVRTLVHCKIAQPQRCRATGELTTVRLVLVTTLIVCIHSVHTSIVYM